MSVAAEPHAAADPQVEVDGDGDAGESAAEAEDAYFRDMFATQEDKEREEHENGHENYLFF